MIDCAVCSPLLIPLISLLACQSIMQASKKVPIKLKGGLRSGEWERYEPSLSPEMEGVVVPQLMNKPPFGGGSYKAFHWLGVG